MDLWTSFTVWFDTHTCFRVWHTVNESASRVMANFRGDREMYKRYLYDGEDYILEACLLFAIVDELVVHPQGYNFMQYFAHNVKGANNRQMAVMFTEAMAQSQAACVEPFMQGWSAESLKPWAYFNMFVTLSDRYVQLTPREPAGPFGLHGLHSGAYSIAPSAPGDHQSGPAAGPAELTGPPPAGTGKPRRRRRRAPAARARWQTRC